MPCSTIRGLDTGSKEMVDMVKDSPERYGGFKGRKVGLIVIFTTLWIVIILVHVMTQNLFLTPVEQQYSEQSSLDWTFVEKSNSSKVLPFSPGLPLIPNRAHFLQAYKNPCWKATDGMRCLPYFFLGGFAKSGTTDLYDKLVRHPQIMKATTKEPHWLTRKRFEGRGSSKFYIEYFAPVAKLIESHSDYITLDASASTVWDNHAVFGSFGDVNSSDPTYLIPHYIHREIPQAKCVLIVRDPVKRLYSDYLYFGGQGTSPQGFHKVVVTSVKMFTDCMSNKQLSALHCIYANKGGYHNFMHRLRIGLYYFHIKSWLSAFPLDQLYVVRLEDYSKHPVTILKQIYAFLGVKEISDKKIATFLKGSTKNSNHKAYGEKGSMLKETEELLKAFYKPYNLKLASFHNDTKFLYNE